ncbi:helix-turn-helix domain-containing protein [Bacillus sp. FJAT-47783]|uniref:PucR family transcriptional regulator n=1 Tax=Bacillus sp. FJAT-47783 TaxID=2922712 RepID=UPI001FADE6C7|nr:helix-turn-helix domain-containing protein [Bacillus sp. FJAT-47783]
MIEQLQKMYNDDFTTQFNNSNEYIWFQTKEKEVFGIKHHRLSENELQLLSMIAERYDSIQKTSCTFGKWYEYIYENKAMNESISSVRFYYFITDRAVEEKDLFVETISGTITSPSVVWLNEQSGWIVDESPEKTAMTEELYEITQSITSDFFIQVTLFIGQLHPVNASLRKKIVAETELIQKIPRSFFKRNSVLTFSDVISLSFLMGEDIIKANVLSHFFGEALQEKELTITIKLFIESNLNVTQTAKKMFMHRNSVQYRIDKFIEWTGIDIRKFREALAVYLFILHSELK